jgi:hypothetical protein
MTDNDLDLILEDVAQAAAVLADRLIFKVRPDIQTAIADALKADIGSVVLSIKAAPTPRIIIFARIGGEQRAYFHLGGWERSGEGLWDEIPVTIETPEPIAGRPN